MNIIDVVIVEELEITDVPYAMLICFPETGYFVEIANSLNQENTEKTTNKLYHNVIKYSNKTIQTMLKTTMKTIRIDC